MTRFALIGLLTILGGLHMESQARADSTAHDRTPCTTIAMGSRVIEACTALIRAGDSRSAYLASYYFTRALNYENAREYDQAFADLNTAISIHPVTDAYLNRGICYLARGTWTLAIVDFNRVIAARPSFVGPVSSAYYLRGFAYLNENDEKRAIADFDTAYHMDDRGGGTLFYRGFAFLREGDDTQAILDFDAAIHSLPGFAIYTGGANARPRAGAFTLADALEGGPTDIDPLQPYAVLLEHILVAHSGRDDRKDFATNAAALHPSAWPAPIVAYFLGTKAASDVLTEAAKGDASLSSGRMCEAVFFLGERAALNRDAARAARLFTSATKRCAHGYLAYQLAKIELKRASLREP